MLRRNGPPAEDPPPPHFVAYNGGWLVGCMPGCVQAPPFVRVRGVRGEAKKKASGMSGPHGADREVPHRAQGHMGPQYVGATRCARPLGP
jgi:hypothetical protein